MSQSFLKDPDALLDYKVDWSDWLSTDTIASSSWAITGPDTALTESTSTNSSTDATVWLDGGTANSTYQAVNSIITAGGREDDRTITIIVTEK